MKDSYIEVIENMSDEERHQHELEEFYKEPEPGWLMMLESKRQAKETVWGEEHGEWIDGEKRAKEYPDTFEVPSAEEIADVEPGDFVKIGCEWPVSPLQDYEQMSCGERFWVQVLTITSEVTLGELGYKILHFTGSVMNEPVSLELENICIGDRVRLYPENVLSILTTFDIDKMQEAFDKNPDAFIKDEMKKAERWV